MIWPCITTYSLFRMIQVMVNSLDNAFLIVILPIPISPNKEIEWYMYYMSKTWRSEILRNTLRYSSENILKNNSKFKITTEPIYFELFDYFLISCFMSFVCVCVCRMSSLHWTVIKAKFFVFLMVWWYLLIIILYCSYKFQIIYNYHSVKIKPIVREILCYRKNRWYNFGLFFIMWL